MEYFEPRFTYHGFQYIQVTGYPVTPGLDALEGRFAGNAVDPAGSFACSNDLINRIHLCTVQSQRCNVQMGVPTDDTQRPERQGWGADALMTAQEAMLNMNIRRIYTKWFRDYRDQQDPLGRIGYIVPRPGGGEDMVWEMALKTDFPGWAWSLRNGKTTITEKWTDGGSQNHVVLGAAIDPWFYNVLAGIKPDERFPGFKRFTIKPFIPDNDLDRVNASVQTIHGAITSSWEKKPGEIIYEIKVPANTAATVHLPAGPGAEITEGGKPVSPADGIKSVARDGSRIVFELGSGFYIFSVSERSQQK